MGNDKARKYLVRFSQLVRTILTHSSQNFVTLDEELKSLKLSSMNKIILVGVPLCE